jgi:acyl-CoA thioesterase I
MVNLKRALSLYLPLVAVMFMSLGSRAHAQIVAFGASNVSGKNVAASEAFPEQLQALLREKGYTTKVLNAGISGDTTTNMLKRVDSDIPEGTTIVLLDVIGGPFNDSQKGISQDQANADMAAINARLKERGVKVLPINASDLTKEYHQEDGIHLTSEGHKLLAQRLLPEVTEVLGPPTGPPPAVKEACLADARRLCGKYLGDDEKRHACMREHRSELSRDCLRAIAASKQQH